MSETVITMSWLTIVSIIGLNGCAAGFATMIYLWRRRLRGGPRAMLAAAASGLLPASVFLPMAFTDREFVGGEGPLVAAIAFVVVWGIATCVALPGALTVGRRLEAPGQDYRSFE